MKRFAMMLVAAAAALAVACEGTDPEQAVVVEFTHTGCSRDTKAMEEDAAEESLLILRYTPSGLEVTHTNAMLNCSIRTDGIACEVELQGNEVYLRTYEAGDQPLKCLCKVEKMSSVITGLKKGGSYTLNYVCRDKYAPVEFVYEKGLEMVLDIDLYKLQP